MPDTSERKEATFTIPSQAAMAGGVQVPDFSQTRNLAAANTQALGLQLILSYYDSSGFPVAAPPQSQWNNWTVTKNMPPTLVGSYIMPGGQVGVMIAFM